MILPDIIINERKHLTELTSGIDTFDHCLDQIHYKLYPHDVVYNYNSRGFRDAEWPDDPHKLAQSIWCLGDSFTVGLGSPITHTWPFLLKQYANQDVVNISLDGASNQWIARKALRVLNEIKPTHMVIQWSYIHRREATIRSVLESRWPEFYQCVKDNSWPGCVSLRDYKHLPLSIRKEIEEVHTFFDHPVTDVDRRMFALPGENSQSDTLLTLQLMQKVERKKRKTKLIHCHVPRSGIAKVDTQVQIDLGEVNVMDIARDGHHYDIKTSSELVKAIMRHL